MRRCTPARCPTSWCRRRTGGCCLRTATTSAGSPRPGRVDFITRVFTPTSRGGGAGAHRRRSRRARGGRRTRLPRGDRERGRGGVGRRYGAAPVLDGATMVPRKVLPVGDGIVIAGGGGTGQRAVWRRARSVTDDGTPRWSRVDADRGRLYGAAAGPDGSIAVVTAGSLVRYSRTKVSRAWYRWRWLDFPPRPSRCSRTGVLSGCGFRPPNALTWPALHGGRRARPDVRRRRAVRASGADPVRRVVRGQRADAAGRRQGRDRRRPTTT